MKRVRKKPGEAARVFLRSVRNSTRKIRSMEEHAEFLRSVVFPGALRLKHVQVQESAPRDVLSQKLAAVDAINRRIAWEMYEARYDRKYAEEVIEDLTDKTHRRLLTLYYLTTYPTYEELGQTHKPVHGFISPSWHDVAHEMHMRLREVHATHRQALIAFEEEAYLPDDMYWDWVKD